MIGESTWIQIILLTDFSGLLLFSHKIYLTWKIPANSFAFWTASWRDGVIKRCPSQPPRRVALPSEGGLHVSRRTKKRISIIKVFPRSCLQISGREFNMTINITGEAGIGNRGLWLSWKGGRWWKGVTSWSLSFVTVGLNFGGSRIFTFFRERR